MTQNPTPTYESLRADIGAKPPPGEVFTDLAKLFFFVYLVLPGDIVDQLLHTGRGIAHFRVFVFFLTSVLLFVLAHFLQSTAGDAVFLLWAVYTFKWIAEYIWAIARQRSHQTEHSLHPGFLILSVIRIKSDILAFALLGSVGLALLVIYHHIGWAVGAIFLTGSLVSIVANLHADYVNRQNEANLKNARIEAEAQSRAEYAKEADDCFRQVDIE